MEKDHRPTAARTPIRHVALVGLMSVGKSGVGRPLAKLLGWPFNDNDKTIEREQGATVRELSERFGVERMHELEADHLLNALADPTPSVVAAAASTIDNELCREQLSRPDVFTVWLDVDPEILARRVAHKSHRPVLSDDSHELLQRQHAQRGPLFRQVADLVISGEESAGAAVARELAQTLDVVSQ
jgi:shikimate kinase